MIESLRKDDITFLFDYGAFQKVSEGARKPHQFWDFRYKTAILT